MAEHLALEQALRDATKVHLDKGLLHALAVDMDGFGNQLLARSAFARNQHRSIGTGYASHCVQHFHQPFGLTYNMAAIQCGSLFFRHLFRGGRKLKGRLDALQKSSIVPRLGYEIECAGLHTLHGKLDTSPCRHQNNGHIGTEHLYLLQ